MSKIGIRFSFTFWDVPPAERMLATPPGDRSLRIVLFQKPEPRKGRDVQLGKGFPHFGRKSAPNKNNCQI